MSLHSLRRHERPSGKTKSDPSLRSERPKTASLRDIWSAGANPALLGFDALHADHVVADVGAAVDEDAGLAGFARGILGDAVGLAVDEGLIAIGMIGDVAIGAGVLSQLEKALEG